MSGIHFGNNFISYQEIASSNFSTSKVYFQTAYNFCKDYLSGSKKFQVKTSGSSGAPKTIYLTRKQLQASARLTINALELKPEYKVFLCISTNHIGGRMMLVRGMELGMEVYLTEPKAVFDAELHTVDFTALVPLQLHHLIQTDKGRQFLNTCKVIIVGGAGMDPVLEKKLDQIITPIYQTFGMTESASHFALRRLNGPEKQLDYHVLQGVQLSTDARGCLAVTGEITNNNLLITNDLIDFTGKNRFRWLGRWDRVINTGGYKVHPELLEGSIRTILRWLGIDEDCVLIGLPNPKWGQQVTLVLETEPLEHETEIVLHTQLKGKLHPYEVPKEFRYLKPIPRTRTGKVDIPELFKILEVK